MLNLHTYLLILLFLFVHQEVVAQSQLGFSGGYISSVPYGANKADRHLNERYKSKGGYSVSIMFRHPLEKFLKASYEAMYSDNAYHDISHYGGLGTQRDYDTENALRHIGIMSFLEYTKGKTVPFNIGAGLGLGFLLKHRLEGTILTRTGGQEEVTVYDGKIESRDKMDFRIGIRGGTEIPISGRISIPLNATYFWSFSDTKAKTIFLQAGLFYSLKSKQ